jgi:ribose 5-phosphate isomerase A
VTDLEAEKRAAAVAGAAEVADGMTVGLGTGSTVAHLLPALAERGLTGLRCVATSPATAGQARELGLSVEDFSALDSLDIAIDGADQATAGGWLIKGGGGAHLREKVVAAAAERFLVICDSSKAVDRLQPPLPLELHAFGLHATLRRLAALGSVELRDAPPSPDGGVIADLNAPIDDAASLAAVLATDPGVAEHGLFPPFPVSEILVAKGGEVRRVHPGDPAW